MNDFSDDANTNSVNDDSLQTGNSSSSNPPSTPKLDINDIINNYQPGNVGDIKKGPASSVPSDILQTTSPPNIIAGSLAKKSVGDKDTQIISERGALTPEIAPAVDIEPVPSSEKSKETLKSIPEMREMSETLATTPKPTQPIKAQKSSPQPKEKKVEDDLPVVSGYKIPVSIFKNPKQLATDDINDSSMWLGILIERLKRRQN